MTDSKEDSVTKVFAKHEMGFRNTAPGFQLYVNALFFYVTYMNDLPSETNLVLIGSGPHNLTLASFLLEADPAWKSRFVVIDPSGKWLTKWDYQLNSQEIVHLRSSSVHHPHPNPMALRNFAKGRFDEFYPPYFLPGTELFREFCGKVINENKLEGNIVAGRVKLVIPIKDTGFFPSFKVILEDGRSLKAVSVAFALGGGDPVVPDFSREWIGKVPNERVLHSDDVDLRELPPGNEHVLIVGGGLTAGHLALGALKRGYRVTIVARRKIHYKLFDAAPGWIGPKYLTQFHRETNWVKRRKMILRARGGGAMTEEIRDQLMPYKSSGQLALRTSYTVRRLNLSRDGGGFWKVDCDWGRSLRCDRIWLCTGTRLDLPSVPFLEEVWKKYPVDLVQGLPVLEEHCRWPGLALYLMGIPSGLRVGPVARNLPGARQAASRIVEALTGVRVPAN